MDEQPREGLKWSGEDATPYLAKTMLELAKSQPYNIAFPSIKSMQVNHISDRFPRHGVTGRSHEGRDGLLR